MRSVGPLLQSAQYTETVPHHISEEGFGEYQDTGLLSLICGSLQSGKREKPVKRSLQYRAFLNFSVTKFNLS